ncbi:MULTISPECIES: oligosaccharide flippase family protein [unclassified Paenibacillus]|uniref:oligosaccharide flippase family protein n=1 Tax=unclassified Paenibacillus TaxID=185978 RepID=UPI003645CD2C
MIKRSVLSSDIFWTLISTLLTTLLSLASYGIAARVLEASGMGEYMLIRRVTTVLVPLLMLGLPIALTRYLALAKKDDTKIRLQYTFATSLPILFVLVIVLLGTLFLPNKWGEMLLGTSWKMLGLPMMILIIGLCFHSFVFALYRGMLNIKFANFMTLINIGFVPFIVLLIPQKNIAYIVSTIGFTMIAVSIIFLANILKDFNFRGQFDIYSYCRVFKQVMLYGLPRVPSFFVSAFLLSLGSIILANQGEMLGVVAITAGLNIIFMFSSAVSPIGIVLLPRGAELMMQGRKKELSYLSRNLILSTIHLSSLFFFLWMFKGPQILHIWLNINLNEQVILTMIVSLAFPFYMIYEVLRNLLDALSSKPLNTLTLSVALSVLLILYKILSSSDLINSSMSLAIASAASLIVLGIMTIILVVLLLRPPFLFNDLIILLKTFILTLSLALLMWVNDTVIDMLHFKDELMIVIISNFITGLLTMIIFIFILYRWKVEWVLPLIQRFSVIKTKNS